MSNVVEFKSKNEERVYLERKNLCMIQFADNGTIDLLPIPRIENKNDVRCNFYQKDKYINLVTIDNIIHEIIIDFVNKDIKVKRKKVSDVNKLIDENIYNKINIKYNFKIEPNKDNIFELLFDTQLEICENNNNITQKLFNFISNDSMINILYSLWKPELYQNIEIHRIEILIMLKLSDIELVVPVGPNIFSTIINNEIIYFTPETFIFIIHSNHLLDNCIHFKYTDFIIYNIKDFIFVYNRKSLKYNIIVTLNDFNSTYNHLISDNVTIEELNDIVSNNNNIL